MSRGTTRVRSPTKSAEDHITLRMQVHTDAPSHSIVLREGPKSPRVRGRVPRIVRVLSLAHHFQEPLETGAARAQMELAELTRADHGAGQ